MRILDVSPRSTFPPQRGAAVRVHNQLRQLSARHEVRQVSQMEPIPWPRRAMKRKLGLPDEPTIIYIGPNVPPNRVGLEWVRRLAGISLCPIEYGGGTKIKLMEALAAGLPSVTFQEALQGTRLVPGQHVLTAAKDTRALLAEPNRLVDSPFQAEGLGRAGSDFVRRHHDWRQISQTLEQALLQLVSRPE